jgi:dipeptidyl aminopeptidase/acylaminoacyl peptidase
MLGTHRWSASLVAVAFGALSATLVGAAAPAPSKPLRIEDALGALSLAGRSPIHLSPDGRWVAYTLEDPRRRTSTGDQRYFYYSRTGAFLEASGCDVWITNTQTGESKNLTASEGTNWDPVWSPDSRLLAFYSDRSGLAHLWTWERDSGRLRQVSDAIVRPFFNFEAPRWSPDGRSLLFKALPEGLTLSAAADLIVGESTADNLDTAARIQRGEPTARVFRAPTEARTTHPATSVSEHDIEVAPFSNRYLADLTLADVRTGTLRRIVRRVKPLGYWFSPEGSKVAFTTYKGTLVNTQQNLYDLVVLPVASAEPLVVAADVRMDYGISVSWSPDGGELAYTTAGPRSDGECYLVSAAGGPPRVATTTKHPRFSDDHRAPLWAASGRSLYFLGDGALWSIDVQAHSAREIARVPHATMRDVIAPHDGGRYWSAEAGRTLYATMRDADTKQVGILRVDLDTGQTSETVREDKVYGAMFSTDAVGATVVYSAQDAQHPSDLWVANQGFSNPRRLTHFSPTLDGYEFGRSRLIDWQGVDGSSLRGALLLPAGYREGSRYPLIVRVYGGELSSNSVNRFGLEGAGVDNLQMLATRGYAVLLPDAPLQTGTPMADIAKTVLPGIDRAIELGVADPERLGVMGHSYGGYSTYALIVQTTRFKAAVASAGNANLLSEYLQLGKDGGSFGIGWAETGQGRMAGTPWQYRERYVENSPLFFFDRVTTPVLIVHGGLDRSEFADEVFVALRRLGKEVTYARYEGEEHWQGTWGRANVVDYWNRVIDWFDQHLHPANGAGQKH